MTSLGSRLTWWYVLVITATMLLALFIGHWLLEKQTFASIDLLNAVEFQEIHDRVREVRGPLAETELVATVAAHARLDSPLYLFQLRRADSGQVVFRSENMMDSVLADGPAGTKNWTTSSGSVGEVRVADFPLGSYRMQIATPLRNVRQVGRSYRKMSGIVLGLVIVLSVFVGHWGSRVALDPIRRIQRTADQISADNLSERIPVGKAGDEVSDLAQLLNRMFDRLEISFGELWRFSADASHELRTPLSLVRLQSEKLLLRGGLSEGQTEAVHQQLEAIARLDSVIEKLLFLAKAGAGSIKPNLRVQDAHALIAAFVEDATVLCEERGVRFTVRENAPLTVALDAILLRQVLLNLVNNALQAIPAGGEIVLSSAAAGSTWCVAVEDTGPGVPADHLGRIFEPFVRAPAQGSPERASGSGLGLTICRNIIELHRGRIHAENRPAASGLRVAFEIPLAAPARDEPRRQAAAPPPPTGKPLREHLSEV